MFILYSYLLHKNPLYISLYLSKWILCNSQMDGSLQLFDLWVGSTSPYSSSMTQSFKCFALSFSQLYCYILWFHNVCIEHFTYLNHKTYQIVSVGQYCHCLYFLSVVNLTLSCVIPIFSISSWKVKWDESQAPILLRKMVVMLNLTMV